jgi:hypothetical protein
MQQLVRCAWLLPLTRTAPPVMARPLIRWIRRRVSTPPFFTSNSLDRPPASTLAPASLLSNVRL